MGAFITGNTSNTTAVIRYSGIQVGASQFDIPVTIFWGQRRLSYNCIWYNNFQRHSVSPKGKGGGKGQEYDYTAAVILALCEGTVDSILNIWQNGSTTTTTTLSKLGMTFFNGAADQAPWSYVTTNYPDQALSYALTSYMAAPKLDLGSSASVPENAFEVLRLNGFTDTLTSVGWTNPTTNVNTPGTDCSMADIIPDFLTNVQYGMGFVDGDIPDLTVYRQYQDGQGLYFSPLLINQETAVDILDRWAQITNSWIYWSGVQLTVVPLGDSPVGDYMPDLGAAYDLDISDFLDKDNPVQVARIDPADAVNRTVIQFTDRTLGYVSNNAEYKDQTLVDRYGLRDDSSTQVDEICVPAVAAVVSQLVGKRKAYVRNTYTWKTSYRYIRLLPGSIVTLTEPNIDLDKFRVRITKVEEDEDLNLSFTAEELPLKIGTYYLPPGVQPTFIPQFPNTQVEPGDVNTPCVVEPDSSFTAGVAQLMLSTSGGPNYGGAEIFVSFQGSSGYTSIGRLTSNGAQGVLTADLPSHADPDTVNTLSVDLTESQTEPEPVTTEDADQLRTLTYVSAQPTVVGSVSVLDNAGELLAFGDTTTTGQYSADLTYLRRGQLGTVPGDHPIGSQFTVLDSSGQSGSTVLFNLPASYIGGPISIKFCAFNGFGPGNNQQDLASVVEYQYTPVGRGYGGGAGGVPLEPTGLVAAPGIGQIVFSWNANATTDNVRLYTLYMALGGSQPFSAASPVWSGQTLSVGLTGLAVGTNSYFLTATNAVGTSDPEGDVDAAIGAPLANALIVKNHGTVLTSNATSMDFTGSGVTASTSGDAVTVSITGGGGGGGSPGFGFFAQGLLTSGETLGQGIFPTDMEFVDGDPATIVECTVPATGTVTLALVTFVSGISTQIGTITFTVGALTGITTWQAGDYTLPAGNIIQVMVPGAADPTLAYITATINGSPV